MKAMAMCLCLWNFMKCSVTVGLIEPPEFQSSKFSSDRRDNA